MKVYVTISKTFDFGDDADMLAMAKEELQNYIIDFAHDDPAEMFDLATWDIVAER